MTRLLVTGAAGFLGRAVLAEARAAGCEVVALVRPGVRPGVRPDLPVFGAGVEVLAHDLAGPDPLDLSGFAAVIHVAARLAGDEAAHRRDTVEATARLLAALKGTGARLVLAGSIAVHDMAALAEGAVLGPEAPLSDGRGRDAYCRAKLAQEALVRASGHPAAILRLGVLYGPGRAWTSHLGFGLGRLVLCPGGDLPVLALHVQDAARGLVRAALCPAEALFPAREPLALLTLVAPDPPSQAQWLRALGAGPVLRLPLAPLALAARLGDLVTALAPALGARLPSLLHGAAFAARFRRLRPAPPPACLGMGGGQEGGTAFRPFPSRLPEDP